MKGPLDKLRELAARRALQLEQKILELERENKELHQALLTHRCPHCNRYTYTRTQSTG